MAASAKVTLAGRAAMKEAGKGELSGGAQHGDGVAVIERAFDLHQLRDVADGDPSLEDGAEALDHLGRQLRQVGDGLLADSFSLAPRLAEQDGGLSGLVGDDFDVEGHEPSVMGTPFLT